MAPAPLFHGAGKVRREAQRAHGRFMAAFRMRSSLEQGTLTSPFTWNLSPGLTTALRSNQSCGASNRGRSRVSKRTCAKSDSSWLRRPLAPDLCN